MFTSGGAGQNSPKKAEGLLKQDRAAVLSSAVEHLKQNGIHVHLLVHTTTLIGDGHVDLIVAKCLQHVTY